MSKLATGEDLEELRAALTLVGESEHIGNECESANYHTLQDFILELKESLHVCDLSGKRFTYDDGSYEITCAVDFCWNTKFVEAGEENADHLSS